MSDILRQCELRELVAELDQALEAIELCDFLEITDGSGGTLLALPLHDSVHLERAIRRGANYLTGLRYEVLR